MISDAKWLAGRKTGVLVFGLAAILAVAVALGYAATVSAQGEGSAPAGPATEPTATPEPTPTAQPEVVPDGKGKDDEDDVGVDERVGESAIDSGASGTACGVTSLKTLAGSATKAGSWSSGCYSTNRSGSYALFYSFTLSQDADVAIDLISSTDTYMFLLRGSGTSGNVVESDDDGGSGRNSYLSKQLSAGTYTIEATTNYTGRTGDFRLSAFGGDRQQFLQLFREVHGNDCQRRPREPRRVLGQVVLLAEPLRQVRPVLQLHRERDEGRSH